MHLRLEQKMHAHPDTVWRALGTEFADISNWSTFVETSRAIDQSEVPSPWIAAPTAPVPGRVTKTKATLTEVLTAYSAENRSLTFYAVGLPRIIRRARDIQTVTDDGDGTCSVSFEIDFDLAGPLEIFGPVVKRRMTKAFAGVLVDLERHAESLDRVHRGSTAS
jgi:hypothetical protein